MRTRRSAGASGRARSSGESKLVSMKWGISSSYSSVSHWQKRSKPAASSGPENASISAAMRPRSCHNRSSLPSA